MTSELILNYPVTTLRKDGCIRKICGWLETEGNEKVFVCANPHSLVIADADPEFRAAIHGADLVTPDGAGIVLASRLRRGQIRERVTGSDIFYGLSRAVDQGVAGRPCRYFFLGSTPETLGKIEKKLTADYPGIVFAGAYSPPFKEVFSEADSRKMVDAVNAAKPDVLWVGMTAPKQEKWIHQHRDRLNVRFIGAVGAVFDFYTGRVKRSSPVFQKLGLEWLPWLIQEPRRLFYRNFVSTPKFLIKVLSKC
jgi:N-acetylglucosaminyldiphosphoundecaprenol N-acetyl-beta-D-mannosaminyltransferase